MPIEESANLLIMLAAIAQRTQSTAFVAPRFWPLLKQWADYLVQTSLDPGDQLCTDDFEGPSPHNANLAAKGIIGLGAYAYLVNVSGDRAAAAYYHGVATSYVPQWQAKAADVDGAHTKLEYDLSNTWSLKYNLLWQKVLQLDLFPQSVFDHEEAFYATRFAPRYGVPLDNRADFTKTDWEMWVRRVPSRFVYHNSLHFQHRCQPSRFSRVFISHPDRRNAVESHLCARRRLALRIRTRHTGSRTVQRLGAHDDTVDEGLSVSPSAGWLFRQDDCAVNSFVQQFVGRWYQEICCITIYSQCVA